MVAGIDSLQVAFIKDVGPFLTAAPGGLTPLAAQLNIPVSQLKEFLRGRSGLPSISFERLARVSGALYMNGGSDEYFVLCESRSLHPINCNMLRNAEFCVSGGGDCDAIYEPICLASEIPLNPRRFLVVDRCGVVFVFLIEQGHILDKATTEHRLSRYDGMRIMCVELYEKLNSHFDTLLERPELRDTQDRAFFAETDLAFRQMTIAPPFAESIDSCYSIGEPPPIYL